MNAAINIHDVPTAAQVCEARKVCKMTQAEFGLLIGAHAMSVSKWERGITIPRDIATRIQRVRESVSDDTIEAVRSLLAPHDLYAWAVLVTGRRVLTGRIPKFTEPVITS